MKLGTRLALITALTLALPLIGWLQVRSLEGALRDSHQQPLLKTARSLAEQAEDWLPALPDDPRWLVHRARNPLEVDGRDGEWLDWLEQAHVLPARTDGPSTRASLLLAEQHGRLHLLLRLEGTELKLNDPDRQGGHQLVLDLHVGEQVERVPIRPRAPGWLQVMGENGQARVQAALQPHDHGWAMELAIIQPLHLDALGLHVLGPDARGQQVELHGSEQAQSLIHPLPGLEQDLQALLPEGSQGWLLTPQGWILSHASRAERGTREEPASHSAAATLGARLLGVAARLRPDALPAEGVMESFTPGDQAEAHWWREALQPGLLLQAQAPVPGPEDRPQTWVLIEQQAGPDLLQAYDSLLKLFVLGLAGMLLIILALTGFSVWLTRRIRRLQAATGKSVHPGGRVVHLLTPPAGSDEVAELGRSMAEMVQRQKEHQDYLRTLADKLAHELRTPVATIRSSLDNLAATGGDATSQPYVERAQAACLRLQSTLQAMSQAARMEESLMDAPLEPLDLGALLDAYASGARLTWPQHEFAAITPAAGRARVQGNAEQLAQLLDKLVENAIDFSPPGSRIVLRLTPRPQVWSLQVDNPGPALPEERLQELFHSMVSVRSAREEKSTHLGMGLYIVRLIAEHHRARVSAINRPGGVRFQVDLPRMGGGRTQLPR